MAAARCKLGAPHTIQKPISGYSESNTRSLSPDVERNSGNGFGGCMKRIIGLLIVTLVLSAYAFAQRGDERGEQHPGGGQRAGGRYIPPHGPPPARGQQRVQPS